VKSGLTKDSEVHCCVIGNHVLDILWHYHFSTNGKSGSEIVTVTFRCSI